VQESLFGGGPAVVRSWAAGGYVSVRKGKYLERLAGTDLVKAPAPAPALVLVLALQHGAFMRIVLTRVATDGALPAGSTVHFAKRRASASAAQRAPGGSPAKAYNPCSRKNRSS
jgi:hypothetical protein